MKQKLHKKTILMHLAVIVVSSLMMGVLFQLILNVGDFLPGLFAAFLLIFLCSLGLYVAWHAAGRDKALIWMMIAAFLIRLVFTGFFTWGLPRFGYPERPQQAGFVFEDAFRREENAWSLAKSDQPITQAFSGEYEVDQYGGMLALSASVYRFVSPDAYRPWLISIISAGVMTLSIPFLWITLKDRFSKKTRLWSGWILALYPEGVLLGSAQLREPFFILLMAIMFWSALRFRKAKKLYISLPVFILTAASLFLFSFRIALPLIGVMLLFIWVDLSKDIQKKWIKVAVWIVILFSVVAVLWLMSYWVDAVLWWDTLVTVRQSGRVQFHLESLPHWLHFPFILIYGILQPVLPAAVAAPAPWIWRGLGIFRAIGWYALMPLLGYVLIRVWSMAPERKKRWLILIILIVWGWILVASARAGGDQWDNPRYRTIFLPWMALAAGWGAANARQTRDRWLVRSIIVEGIFLAFFTQWYFSRYYPSMPRLEFWIMIALILFLSAIVILGGWLWDRRKNKVSNMDEP